HPAFKLGLIVAAAFVGALVAAIGYTPLGRQMPSLQQGIASAGQWVMANPRTMAVYVIIALIAAFVLYLASRYALLWRIHFAFNRQFEKLQRVYGSFLAWSLQHRAAIVVAFALLIGVSMVLATGIGQDFFPSVDAGQIRLHVRAPAGTRIEQSERYYAAVQDIIRRDIPANEVAVILDNIGIPNSSINLALSDGSVNAASEGEILVSLKEGHQPTVNYIRKIRDDVAKELPELLVWSAPSDIATQVLNFGLPASIDVQVAGPAFNGEANKKLAMAISNDLAKVPGVTDRRLQQVTSAPDLRVNIDRALADQMGVTQRDVAGDLLVSLSSTAQIAPNFWLNPQNGVSYPINVQTPQYRITSINDLTNTPVVPTLAGASDDQTQLLGNLATLGRGTTASNITHYDVKPTYDVLLGVQYLDLGTVANSVQKVIDGYNGKLPKGTTISLRGQVESMNNSFRGMEVGLVFAVVLVYLLMVINFQSWLDPLIILMALPGAGAGIIWMLWATHTTLSVPSLMGALMTIGVATANAILLITFANDQRRDLGMNAHDAALSAGLTRLRPVLMTAAAMIIGMLPMSLGLGEGGEQNAPLGRAVIGGLLMATFATLIFVPVVYSLLRNKALETHVEKELQ
ncbi:MAG: efflux RND transporter permease subunit, partial [Tepidisphaeraceae bacterium]